MSNPIFPGGPYQPPNPFQQGGQQPNQGGYQNLPYSAPQPFGAQPQYGAPQQYGPPPQYGQPAIFGAPQPFGQYAQPRRGSAAAIVAMIILLGCAGLTAFFAYTGRDEGPANEWEARATQAIVGVVFLDENSTIDDFKASVNITWVIAVVTVLLAIVVAATRSSVAGGIAAAFALIMTISYVAVLGKIHDNLGKYSQYLDDSELAKAYVWPAIALAAWLFATIACFAASSARRRRVTYPRPY